MGCGRSPALWGAAFVAADTLTGEFSGSWKDGEAFVGWDGSFNATREVSPRPLSRTVGHRR
ncbi:MAG: hypothetical protein ABIO70_34205 [Pseudomonadota bacterium]